MNVEPTKLYTDLEIEQLAVRLLAGDRQMIPRIIDACIPHANMIGRWWVRKFPRKRDDIIASALHGMVVGVHRAADGSLEDEKILAYLSVVIRSHIKTFLEKDFTIPVPRKKYKEFQESEEFTDYLARTMRPYNAEGKSMYSTMRNGVITHIPVMMSHDSDGNDEKGTATWEVAVEPQTMEHDYEDIYKSLHLDEREIRVVRMRMEGYTVKEIGRAEKVTYQWIEQIIYRLKDRWAELGLRMPVEQLKISGTKVCKGPCGSEKSLSDFYKIGPDKFKGTCISCMKAKRDSNE